MDELDNVLPFRLPGKPRHGGVTFASLAQEWLRVEGARLVEPENERRHVDHLRPLWDMTEAELRPRVVRSTLLGLLRPAGPLSPATVNKVQATGRRIIREAQMNEEWAGLNPFEIVRRLRESPPPHRTLSLAECRTLLPFLRPDRRREALVMLYLGLRPGEFKALQRIDVDLGAGTLNIRRSNGRDRTKTGKARLIPVPDGLRPVLEEALRESPEGCQLVFPGRNGERQRADAKLSRMLQDKLRQAGLVTGFKVTCRRKGCGYKSTRTERAQGECCERCGMKLWFQGVPLAVRFYDLRHSAATLHREAGADPLAIQLVLGHAPQNLTDSVYTHLSMEYLRRELNKLSF